MISPTLNRTAINSMFTSLSGELNELAIYEAGYAWLDD